MHRAARFGPVSTPAVPTPRRPSVDWPLTQTISAMILCNPAEAVSLASQFGMLDESGKSIGRNREREEIEARLRGLGLGIPWSE